MLQAVRCVCPRGHILYTTCTYDPAENERVVSYLLRRVPGWQAVEIPLLAAFRSDLCDFPALPENDTTPSRSRYSSPRRSLRQRFSTAGQSGFAGREHRNCPI